MVNSRGSAAKMSDTEEHACSLHAGVGRLQEIPPDMSLGFLSLRDILAVVYYWKTATRRHSIVYSSNWGSFYLDTFDYSIPSGIN